MSFDSRPAMTIRIRCPVRAETWRALVAGDFAALKRDAAAGAMIAIIRSDNPLGDFGLYRGVFEISLGIEGFTPTAEARPTAGAADAATLSPTVTITTYAHAGADRTAMDTALAALVAAHPWEVPVIEVWDAGMRLAVRTAPT